MDKLENGMTYEQAVEIIGGEGELQAEVDEKGTVFYTVIYMKEKAVSVQMQVSRFRVAY